jgi:hypothetical protein
MIVLIYFVLILSGFSMGVIFSQYLRKYLEEKSRKERVDSINEKFETILYNLRSGDSSFKSRVNNSVYIATKIDDIYIDILYMMDKNKIAIFKDNDCIYTTELVNKKTIDDIIEEIILRYKADIEDTVSVLGIIFSREEFENIFKIKFENLNITINEGSEIDKIISNNSNSYDIDEILDKIGKRGMNSLSPDEKKYLEDYSKNG